MENKKAILVTDGDRTASNVVELAANNLGLEVISESAGNPTPHSGQRLIEIIKKTEENNPIVVMFDDQGDLGEGVGEEAMKIVVSSPEIEVLGVLAVASDAKDVRGVNPDFSITNQGEIVDRPVDKKGEVEAEGHQILEGDTVDIINAFNDLLVVGTGDLGKMQGKDDYEFGAPITTKALQEILKRSEELDEDY